MNFDKKLVERVRQQYPEGTRIRLESLCNEERDMPPGLCGTVIGVDDQPTLLMKWDNDKSLSLFPGKDSFQIIEQVEDQCAAVNIELFKKLQQEQKRYERRLCTLPFDEVLNKSWETVVRRDILMSLECTNLEHDQAAALLKLPNPLKELVQMADELETRHMDDILGCIREKADSLLTEQTAGPTEQTM